MFSATIERFFSHFLTNKGSLLIIQVSSSKTFIISSISLKFRRWTPILIDMTSFNPKLVQFWITYFFTYRNGILLPMNKLITHFPTFLLFLPPPLNVKQWNTPQPLVGLQVGCILGLHWFFSSRKICFKKPFLQPPLLEDSFQLLRERLPKKKPFVMWQKEVLLCSHLCHALYLCHLFSFSL